MRKATKSDGFTVNGETVRGYTSAVLKAMRVGGQNWRSLVSCPGHVIKHISVDRFHQVEVWIAV